MFFKGKGSRKPAAHESNSLQGEVVGPIPTAPHLGVMYRRQLWVKGRQN